MEKKSHKAEKQKRLTKHFPLVNFWGIQTFSKNVQGPKIQSPSFLYFCENQESPCVVSNKLTSQPLAHPLDQVARKQTEVRKVVIKAFMEMSVRWSAKDFHISI